MTDGTMTYSGPNVSLADIPYQGLSREDKIALTELLWEDLAFQDPSPLVRESHLKLVRERMAFREANPAAPISWEAAKKEVEKSLASHTGH